ncbi:MAG: DUF2490 domain-containing protein [Candidatus Omnitrophica bacterium]|nr:DUF2490 domain-containing protein [Candidatus Omnitrophota bacterium]
MQNLAQTRNPTNLKRISFGVLVLLVLSVFTCAETLRASDDFQSWNSMQLKVVDTKYVDYVTYGELRLTNDAGKLGFWQTTQKLQYDFFKYLGLATNYTYLESEVANAKQTRNEFKYHHRFELEANPRWSWKDRLNLRNRNRVEFRWIEGRGSDNTRWRTLGEVEVPLHKIPIVKSVYMSDELFIDFPRQTINETRIVPVGLTVGVIKGIDLKVYYMIQSQKGNTWSSNQVLGTQLNLDF